MMAAPVRILAFAGSAREGSYNHRLLLLGAGGARQAGAEVTIVRLGDFPMPLYHADLEAREGLPESVKQFKRLMLEHDGFLIGCPEYNSSITPLLKNVMDWASRAEEGEPPLACYRGKVAALLSASPGALGGLRALRHLREILSNIEVLVLPEQWAVPRAHEAFDEAGELKDPQIQKAVVGLGEKLIAVLKKLKS